jgi:D-3-phosphoglycerate dehydrogenase
LPKVLIAQPIYEEGINLLLNQGFEVKKLPDHSIETLKREISDADAILVRDAHVSREVIKCAKNLKVISRHGAGLERIDVETAYEMGIRVTRTPIANSVSVAEHTLAMMLALSKNLLRVDRENRNGNFNIRHDLYGFELMGKTLGILGMGNIGRRLAKRALYGLEMRVVGYDPYVDPNLLDEDIVLADNFYDVLRAGDFVTLHLPLNKDTIGIIGLEQFKLMKQTAFFINCARGPIVKEEELVIALRQGFIAGAGIDVYDPDPPVADHPLFAMDSVIVTPHTAAHTHEAMRNMAVQAAQGIIEVLTGKQPTWEAN